VLLYVPCVGCVHTVCWVCTHRVLGVYTPCVGCVQYVCKPVLCSRSLSFTLSRALSLNLCTCEGEVGEWRVSEVSVHISMGEPARACSLISVCRCSAGIGSGGAGGGGGGGGGGAAGAVAGTARSLAPTGTPPQQVHLPPVTASPPPPPLPLPPSLSPPLSPLSPLGPPLPPPGPESLLSH
jgi:hypothetical protein